MRPSNSDGNLHRWSSNLAAEPGPLSAAAAAAVAARDAAPGNAGTGAACEPVAAANPTQANGTGDAQPQHQGLGQVQKGPNMGLEVAVEGAPGQRPPLGGPHSSLGLSTPLLSCDPSTAGSTLSMATAEAEEGQQGHRLPNQGEAEDVQHCSQEQHMAEGAACLGPALASLPAGVGGGAPQGGQRRGRAPVAHQQSEPLPQSGVAASAVLPCGSDGAPLRKVVTLRVPQDEQGGPEAATTFTLAATTRTDFGPHPNTPSSAATSSSLATVSAPHLALASADAPSSSSSGSGTAAWAAHGLLGGILGRRRSLEAGRAAPASPARDPPEAPTAAAASHVRVFEAMGSVLGPAAGAVTLAVASAATTAGAALATAAATASHLLQPSPSPARQPAAAPPPSPPTRNATSASPFARAAKEAVCAAVPPGAIPAACGPARAAVTAAAVAPVGPPRSPAATLPRRASSSDLLPGARSGCAMPFPIIPVPSAGGAAAASRSVSSASSLAAPAPAPGSAAPAMDRAASCASSGATSSIGTPSSAAGPVLPPHLRQVLGSTGSGSMAAQQVAVPLPQPSVDPSGRCWQPPAPTAPYKLRCVAHSLGGMSVLVHLVNRLREGRPHNVSRLLLLTPAGFHKYCPRVRCVARVSCKPDTAVL